MFNTNTGVGPETANFQCHKLVKSYTPGVGYSLFDPVSSDLPPLQLGESICCSEDGSFDAYLSTKIVFSDVSKHIKVMFDLNVRASEICWKS